jgi:hypothetical protein
MMLCSFMGGVSFGGRLQRPRFRVVVTRRLHRLLFVYTPPEATSVTIPVFPNSSAAQGTSLKDQLVGTWIYVSSTAKRDDGSNVPRPSLQGAVTYTGDGRFHFIVTRTDAPKYASGDLTRPSPDEAMAIASGGSIAYTGTYTVDENSKTIHVSIETSTFPNLVGAPNQRRIITSITADEMKFTNPRTLAGLTLEIVWKRAK